MTNLKDILLQNSMKAGVDRAVMRGVVFVSSHGGMRTIELSNILAQARGGVGGPDVIQRRVDIYDSYVEVNDVIGDEKE